MRTSTPKKKSTAKKKVAARKKTATKKPATAPDSIIGSDIADRLLRADLANIVKKVKSGKSLNSNERAILTKASTGEELDAATSVKNQTELAEILGVTRRTIGTWSKREGAPKPSSNGSHDVQAWRDFQKKIDGKGALKIEDPEQEGDLPSEPILKRKKLLLFCQEKEMQLAEKRGELIDVGLVRETWAKKCASANSFLRKRLENELPSDLEGLEAADIYDELISVVDQFNELMHSGGSLDCDHEAELKQAIKNAKKTMKASTIYKLCRDA